MRRLIVAGAILAIFLTVPLSMAAAAPNPAVAVTDSTRATAALQYLLAAQGANGSIDGSLGETADFIIGAAATGYDPAALTGCGGGKSALSFLATKSDEATVTADAAQTGKAILAVVAAGGNPASFSGRDLSARLAALYHSATGAYGDGSTFSQSYAILAVAASGGSVPAAATDKLIALQGTDGAWTYSTAKEAGDGDSNSTAVALMALRTAGIPAADSAPVAALTYLHTQQVDDGGSAYSTAWGAASDADSDAEVLQALIAAGEDPLGVAWSKGSGNVLTAMRAAQGADGGFNYTTYGESAFTTSQIPAALMGAPYAAAVHFTAGLSIPKTSCASSSPSPSPTAGVTSTASPTATVGPTPAPTVRPTARPTATVGPTAAVGPTATVGPTHTPTPTVRPTARSTAVPIPAATPTATPTPTDSATATPTVTSTPMATAIVAGETAEATTGPGRAATTSGSTGSSGSGGIPTPIAYAFAALAGLGAVAVGGWLMLARPTKS